MRDHFSAPWSAGLKVVTAAVLCLLLLASLMKGIWVGLLMAIVVAACALFAVRGYHIGPKHLLVRRLGWSTKLDLASVKRAEADPQAMHGSLRLLGNGGLFSWVGWFRNSRLGWYVAFATDPRRSVVLDLTDSRRVVVTPDDPQAFLQAISASRRPI